MLTQSVMQHDFSAGILAKMTWPPDGRTDGLRLLADRPYGIVSSVCRLIHIAVMSAFCLFTSDFYFVLWHQVLCAAIR